MEKAYEKKYHNLEDIHWWFVSRRLLVKKLLKRFPKNSRILDVGCSSGTLIKELNELGYREVFGVDISEDAQKAAQGRGVETVKIAPAEATDYASETFDIIVASDILEHIKDDTAAVRDWGRLLIPGGTLLLFVPAHMYLWSNHDVTSQHYRRYSRSKLLSLLKKNDFVVVRNSYWNFSLFPFIALFRFMHRIVDSKESDDLSLPPPFINWIFKKIILFENVLITAGVSLLWGVSLFFEVQKPR